MNFRALLLYTDVGVRLQVGLGGAPPQREVLVAVFLLGLHRRGVALARGPGREFGRDGRGGEEHLQTSVNKADAFCFDSLPCILFLLFPHTLSLRTDLPQNSSQKNTNDQNTKSLSTVFTILPLRISALKNFCLN